MTRDTPRIRPAAPDDAEALLEIYRPLVLETAVSFEIEPPGVEELKERIRLAQERWTWLVAEDDQRILGYAYGSSHRSRAAYAYSVETTVYVREGCRAIGTGKRLYLALFDDLARRGYCNAYAGIALPNEASVALHRSVGFSPVGVFRSVGYKFGAWHDVSWWQKSLNTEAGAPPGQPGVPT